jgi:hypothetical protein
MIANILRWLTLDVESEGQVVTIDLQKDLFYWANSIAKEERWESFSDLINVSLKHFKDNYKSIIKELKVIQQERYQRKREYKEAVKEEKEEEKVIDLIPKRKKEDLELKMLQVKHLIAHLRPMKKSLQKKQIKAHKK